MPDRKTYTAKNIFTGEEWLTDHSIITDGETVIDIIPAAGATEYHTILPAFVDLQLYGAYGKLFSVYPEAGTLKLTHQYCCEGGAYWFQPTVATNTIDVFKKAIDGVRQYWAEGGEGCLGLHIEGPWISKAKRGAHIESLVHSPSIEEVEDLLAYGKGVISMITLAPEVCSEDVVECILKHNIIISAGHSNAGFEKAMQGFNQGISAVTHLFNAMSALQHREPGMVGAAMLSDKACASIIADGHHVDFAAIAIAKQVMKERLFLITDAVTETSEGAYQHYLSGDKYEANCILSGSALTMAKSVRNIIQYCGIDKTEAIKMACTYPARAINQYNRIGKIAKGLKAHFILTDENISSVQMI